MDIGLIKKSFRSEFDDHIRNGWTLQQTFYAERKYLTQVEEENFIWR